MTSPTEPAQPSDDKKKRKKLKVRTHTPRPDELSRECFEFIAAVDHYKRSHMRSFLEDREVLALRYFEQLSIEETALLLNLTPSGVSKRQLRALGRLRRELPSVEDVPTPP